MNPPISEQSYLSRFRGRLAADEASTRIATYDRIRAVPFIELVKARSFELLEIGPGSQVLDAGCGCGEDVRQLAALTAPGGHAIGVDSDAAVLAEAESRSLAATEATPEFVLADAAALPFADATFDGVRADRVLLHAPRPDLVLAELRRVTEPGGRIVITEVSNTLAIDDEQLAASAVDVLNGFQSPAERRGSVVELLPLLLARVTEHPVEVVRERAVTSDWESMTALVQFDVVAQSLIDAGRLAPDWLDRVHQAADEGRAHMQIKALHVYGSAPRARSMRTNPKTLPSTDVEP
jgi:ubiquinone/menaquinone biosynthesis C-methylase UbiE